MNTSNPSTLNHPHTALPPNEVCQTLASRLLKNTQGQVLFDAASRGRYATDASIYQIMPVGVFVPQTTGDVETALAVARELKVPVLPRGGGTSQCGQTTGAALVVDCSKHLRKVLHVDPTARQATVEPGLVLDHLNAQLKALGLWYPVDVSTSGQATLGGMAGNNSCGSRSLAYGNMVHNVLGAQAWLSSGALLDFGPVGGLTGAAASIAQHVHALARSHAADIQAQWPKVLRRVGGYNLDIFDAQSVKPYTADGHVNLAHLLVGSEGTLAFTKTLTLQLSALPKHKVLGVVNFASFRKAMESAQHIVKLGPTAVELVDATMVQLALNNPAFKPTMAAALIGQPAAILLVEFAGDERGALLQRLQDLVALMGDLGLPGSVVEMPIEAAQKELWEVRKAGLNIMMSLKGDGKPVSFIEDCAVPLEHLADYTDALTEVFERHGTRGTWYAHASVGTLHVRPILDMRRSGATKMRAMAEEAAALVRRYKGAYSGEHGDGLCRGEWIQWQFGPRLTEAFADIKRTMDPLGLLNPGKIINPPAMDDTALFRFRPEPKGVAGDGVVGADATEGAAPGPKPYRRIALTPVLDWSAWNVTADAATQATTAPGTGGDSTGGWAMAVEMCNNNGHCRKFDAGTMCPSYRATRDEQHLTRGRANTLRLALSGQLGPDALASQELHDTMALCVGCKGCKRECPTGVDMARMKTEFLAHYTARHGHTVKDRLVAHLPAYAQGASRIAVLMNLGETLRQKLPVLGRLVERATGLSAQRAWPRWRADTFWRQSAKSPSFASLQDTLAVAQAGGLAAVLFVDTFNGSFERENAQAAARVLQAAGYTVHTLHKADGHHCCGRTYLASGMVEQAKAHVGALVDALLPLAQAGVAVVGLEPSCLLTLRDESLVMGLGDKAVVVSKVALLFEEFIAREVQAGRFKLALKPSPQPILVHGHCHQKAFGAMGSVMDVLRLIPDAKPQLIETSCCGMAGSFGYEAAHQSVSKDMAEASLLPAIRNAPNAVVVADGTSCRHQIAHGTQRQAVHVAVLLAGLLDGPARAAA